MQYVLGGLVFGIIISMYNVPFWVAIILFIIVSMAMNGNDKDTFGNCECNCNCDDECDEYVSDYRP